LYATEDEKASVENKSISNNDPVIGGDFNYKIIVVGNMKVGKTSIARRFVNNKFDEAGERTKQV